MVKKTIERTTVTIFKTSTVKRYASSELVLLLKFENLAAKFVLHYAIFFGSLQFSAKMLVIRLYPSVMKNLRPK